MVDVLYVAGYSRSGSTVLDMVLGAHPSVASTGELTFLLDDARDPQRRCTCGIAYADCAFWSGWVGQLMPNTEAASRIRRIESRANLDRLLDDREEPRAASLYADYARTLVDYIRGRSGAKVIVDSSKSARDAAGRPVALSRLAGLDVAILHLTRDPRATLRSYIDRGSNWVAEGHRKAKPLETWRPIMGWTKANRIAADLSSAFPKDRYLRLRFEDFLSAPRERLAEIGAVIGLDMARVSDLIEEGAAFTAEHNVGGNRARLAPQKIRPGDALSSPALPVGHALALKVVAGSELKRMRYR